MENNFFKELEKESEEKRKEELNIKTNSDSNGISVLIKTLCWILLILGFVVGVVSGDDAEDFLVALNIWAIYGGCALGGFALAEIIQLLHDIRSRLYKIKK